MVSGDADPVPASVVRRRIRELVRGGVLPAKPESTLAVPSPGGRFCTACGSAIEPGTPEHETLTRANVRLRLHSRCRDLWMNEAEGEG